MDIFKFYLYYNNKQIFKNLNNGYCIQDVLIKLMEQKRMYMMNVYVYDSVWNKPNSIFMEYESIASMCIK